jgi:hypothetical protein
MRTSGALVAIFVLGVFVETATAIDIDTCGITIPDREIGTLTTDLVCPTDDTAIRIGYGATLNMNGHSIETPGGHAVWCNAGKCTITGGSGDVLGEIRGGQAGIYLQRKVRADISNVVIRDCEVGIEAEDWHAGRKGARATLVNVQLTGNAGVAVHVGNVRASNVLVEDNPGSGITAGSSSRLKAEGLIVARNATSAGCQSFGCAGIEMGKVSGSDLSVTDNAGMGIRALKLTLRDSTVIENRRLGALRSLEISELPRLRDVACDASFGWGSQSQVTGACARSTPATRAGLRRGYGRRCRRGACSAGP